MSRFTPQFLDELRARTTLSTLIGQATKLQRAGREWRACCPFHDEKTPSFYVNDDKGFYHCFGCSAHGDAIRWLTDQRGLAFVDAVKELADSAGLALPAPDPQAVERATRAASLHDVMAAASAWFVEQLHGEGGTEARTYLKKRGIGSDTTRAFAIGFAPDRRDALKAALTHFGEAMLVEAGLLIQVDDKTPYDRFRGRLMIPIRDPRGRVIAFGGRILGTGEPKYLNSPDTPLFDKGRTLYNLDRAAPAARKAQRLIVVEGYLDVIALAQVHLEETVAPLGTAITETQLEHLWRVEPVPTLCLDGDAAGQKASVRAAHRALPMLAPDRSLAFALLPDGQDPDDILRKEGGYEQLAHALKEPRPLISIIYEHERRSRDISTPEARAGLRQAVLALADKIENLSVQAEYKRSFNSMYFEEFGWKKSERRTIGEAVIKTGPRAPRNLLHSYLRSTLYGLARFPVVLSLMLEPVSFLKLSDERLLPWRETMVEAIVRRPDLDDDALQSILLASNLKPFSRQDIQTDLRFPWDIDPAQAVRTLGGMVEFVAEEQGLLSEIDAMQQRLHGGITLEEYLSLAQERSELDARKRALYEVGYRLGGGDAETDLS